MSEKRQGQKVPNTKGVTSTESRTARGRAILEAWDTSRQPFILYLRKFRFIMYHGPDSRMLLENHFWATLSPHRVGVLTVIDPTEDPLPGAYGHGAPAVEVADDQWQSAVSDLISKAEMIVSEVPLLGEGAALELEMCIQSRKTAQTVVLIPPPGGPFEALDDVPPIKSFPRVIHLDELPEINAIGHFVFHDLVDRACALASLKSSERVALATAGLLYDRFPVTYTGLRAGYQNTAIGHEGMGEFRRAARSYFRALVVAVAEGDDLSASDIAEQIARLSLMIGDRTAAMNYLGGAIRFAQRVDDAERLRRLNEELTRVAEKL